MATNYYVLYPDPNDERIAVLEQRELKEEDKPKLPFVQSTGSQSPALGPVIKRSYQKGKGGGPSDKILNSTLAAFAETGMRGERWSDYFSYAHGLLSRPTLSFKGNTTEGAPALHQAVQVIDETKTAYLSILDPEGNLPGERDDYRSYLQETLAAEKYSTKAIPPIEAQQDALSSEITTVYPNSLTGAGLNLTNVDRLGVFSDLDEANAWKKFALGAANADLLFIFSFHMRGDFVGRVAGEQALILPHLSFEQQKRQRFVRDFKEYIDNINKSVGMREKRLLRHFKDYPEAIASISILWASFGQKLENVTGIVTDVLPSRLSEIADTIEAVKSTPSSVFPVHTVAEAEPDLGLNSLGTLLRRPGGRKNKKANEGARLFELKRDIAARVYHRRPLATERLWEELLVVAREYLMEAAESGNAYGLLNEGVGKKGTYLTLAGWVKHLARTLYFFRQLEVYPQMNSQRYEPKRDELRAFFQNAEATAGLDSPEKVYAFLLGVLFGKVMEVQGARGVNVGANALTWLKRMNLTGDDLPGLYIKVREKLLAYDTEKSARVRAVIEELGHLGAQIGKPRLSKTDAGYYVLLGQSLTKTLIPAKEAQV
jgi:CRISPR-associated protein Csh1